MCSKRDEGLKYCENVECGAEMQDEECKTKQEKNVNVKKYYECKKLKRIS